MSSTPLFSPDISTTGLSSASTTSLSLSLSLGRALRRRTSKSHLHNVIKIIKQAVKSQEAAQKTKHSVFNALRTWSASFKDDNTREFVSSVVATNDQWNGDSEFIPKLHLIVARLQELRREEEARDSAHKLVVDAEKTYYRALYKNYPRSEVETLERSCKALKLKAKASDQSFKNSIVATLSQCLSMFYQQLNASSELNKQCAEKILDVLAQFDDSMKYHDQENTIPPDSTKPVSPVFPSSFAASRQGSTLKTDQIFQRPKSIVYEPTVTTEDNNQVQRIDAPRSEGVSTNANYSYDQYDEQHVMKPTIFS